MGGCHDVEGLDKANGIVLALYMKTTFAFL